MGVPGGSRAVSSRGDAAEEFEIFRKGLAGAARIVDGDRRIAKGGQGETHGHAMIIVGVDGGTLNPCRWRDFDKVLAFNHFGTHLAQLRCHGTEPVDRKSVV